MKKRIPRAVSAIALAVLMCLPGGLTAQAGIGDVDGAWSAGLVLDLPFDGNLTDATGKHTVTAANYDGATTVTYVNGADGGANRAVRLSGNTYLNIGSEADLNPESMTLSFWINPSAAITGEQIVMWNKNAYNSAGWYVTLLSDTVPIKLSVGTEPFEISVHGARADFFPVGKWTHIAVTFDGTAKETRIFRNGVPQTLSVDQGSAASAAISDSGVHKSIGWNGPNHHNGGWLANSALDGLKLFDGAVTEQEVVELYNEAGTKLAATADFTSDVILDLKFDGDTNDASSGANNYSVASGTAGYTTGVDGAANHAFLFNGSTWLETPASGSEDLNPESFTVSFWVKPTGTMSGEQIFFWNKNQYNQAGWYIGSNTNDKPLVVSVGVGTGGSGSGQPLEFNIETSRAAFFPADTWTHIAVSYDGAAKECKIYRDGIMQIAADGATTGNATAAGAVADSGVKKMIGRNGPSHNSGGNLSVALDNALMWKRVVPQNALADLYGLHAELDAQALVNKDTVSLPAQISSSITLPVIGQQGSRVRWISSSLPGILSADGTVVRPEETTEVTLTAAFTYDGKTAVKTFTVTVLGRDESDGTVVLEEMMENIGTDSVELLDAYLLNNEMNDVSYLLSLDPQRFLYHFYKTAGVTQPTGNTAYDTLNGEATWERTNDLNFRGHMFGHWLGACALAYRSADTTTDQKSRLLTKIQTALAGLAACQTAYGNTYSGRGGYIAPFTEKRLYELDGVSGGGYQTAYDGTVYVPYYNLHKVVEGLLQVYSSFRDIGTTTAATESARDDALEIVSKFGDYMYDCRVNNASWSDSRTQGTEYGGFNEAFYELYAITKSAKHLRVAEAFDETSNFQRMVNGEDYLTDVHANTTIPKYIGAVKRYEVFTENETLYNTLTAAQREQLTSLYLTAAENFWDIVVRDHSYITGDNSTGEHFRSIVGGNGLKYDAVTRNPPETCETCNAYNMLKLTRELYRITGDKKYSDFYERTFINTIVSSMNPETGGMTYFNPMYSGYYKLTNANRFWCCTGTGVENHVKYGDSIYFKSGGDVFVNMYYSSILTLTELNLKLTQETSIPVSDSARFTVATASGSGEVAAGTNLRFRRPDWIAGTPTVKVNGDETAAVIEGGYIVVKGAAAGDVIELTIPAGTEAWSAADDASFVAFRYGPLVLSATLSAVADVSAGDGTGILVLHSSDPASEPNTINITNGQTVAEWKADINNNLVRASNATKTITGKTGTISVPQIRFQLTGTSQDSLVYIPHYMQYANRYGLYMNVKTGPAAPAPEREPILRYTFDAGTITGTTVEDVTGNGNDGALMSGAAASASSPLGNTMGSSLSLDGGAQYVDITTNPLDGLVNFTILAWVKPDALDSWARVFDFGPSGEKPGLFFTINRGSNLGRLAFETASSNTAVNLTSALSTSAWAHLACVIDGTSARLYINGVLAGENAAFNYDSALAGQFSDNYLGRSQYGGDEYYDGGIDDFQIYNYALSGDEVADIYRGEEPRRDLEFSSTLSLTAQWQAEVHNPGYFDSESVTVIVAYYNAGGRLIYVLTKSGTVAGLGSLTLNEYAPQGAASAKAFFWDTASYVPLTA